MASGDLKTAYGTSTDLAVNNGLEGLASSATWVAGWESDLIDNTSNLYLDYLISGQIQVHDDAAPTVGEIRVYIVAMISDSVWPDVFDGTGSAETISLVNVRDAVCKLGAVITNTATQNLIYPFGPFSVSALFGGVCPPKFVIFIAHSTVTTLHTSGQVVTYQGVYQNCAP